ncbi:DUF3597 domain-containing protein [Qipengyuania sp.]|uniref:DUF3597 domain-containing protein n=1 Tax=Qipengyuania sp. TaxID=2004515 RepID=UPI0035C7A071
MSIFGKIKDAIFGHDEKPTAPAPRRPTPPAPGTVRTDSTVATREKPHAKPVINIENSLDSMPGADRLNWRTSIVDLMKLIGVDSDYDSRKALAHELGRADYSGSPEDNIWLHQRVMQELANNGGEVPEKLR